MSNYQTLDSFLFIGGAFLNNNRDYVCSYSKGAIQNAANLLQWNYINGIESNTQHNVDILNAVFIGSYPKYFKKLYVKGNGKYSDDSGRSIFDASFLNVPFIVESSKFHNLKKELKNWIVEKTGSPVIVAYGYFVHNIKLLAFAKKINPKCKTCLIIPDLPQYMSLKKSNSIIKRKIINHSIKAFESNRNLIDFYTVITQPMADYLKLNKNQYVVIDGMCKVDEETINQWHEDNSFSFLYTGGLSVSYGTDVLVNSFISMKNSSAELWICGDGPYVPELINICKTESRIHYLGVIPQKECILLQHKASCLVNPRNDSEITKYSFPSKTMEYLASGKPVIAKRLEGMDISYSEYFYQFDKNEDLADVMDRVSLSNPEELLNKGIKGKEFVKLQKNSKFQTGKLLDLLCSGGEDLI